MRIKPFDVYCGFMLYHLKENLYIAKNSKQVLSADTLHDIYAAAKLHTV
jgi:hypothetical protein